MTDHIDQDCEIDLSEFEDDEPIARFTHPDIDEVAIRWYGRYAAVVARSTDEPGGYDVRVYEDYALRWPTVVEDLGVFALADVGLSIASMVAQTLRYDAEAAGERYWARLPH